MEDLSHRLNAEYGSGFSLSGLKDMKAFYIGYPRLLRAEKGHAVRGFFPTVAVASPKTP